MRSTDAIYFLLQWLYLFLLIFIDFLLIFIDFCCYLQYFVGVMAILLGSGAPKVNFYCYLHYFNIRSTDAIYFLLQWLY